MKRLLSILSIFTLCTIVASAQNVNVNASIDSLRILIGEQAKIKLEVSTDANQHVVFPSYQDTLIKNIVMVKESKVDTQLLNNGKRMALSRVYTVTSFDSALYYIPPMVVMVNNKPYSSKSLALQVNSIPVDTLHADQYYPEIGVMNPPFIWKDWYMTIASAILILPFLFLIIYLIKRIMDNKPIIRIVKVEKKLPPHQLAIQEMERIKEDKIWKQGLTKDYYTQLTEVLRTYIKDRFGFNAMEMTSSEIIEKLLELNKTEDLSELKELFQTADLVKFAKYDPMINENDANLINAIDFVNETKEVIDESEQKKEPEEIKIIEKRPLKRKIFLITCVVILGILLVSSITYVVVELYNYFI